MASPNVIVNNPNLAPAPAPRYDESTGERLLIVFLLVALVAVFFVSAALLPQCHPPTVTVTSASMSLNTTDVVIGRQARLNLTFTFKNRRNKHPETFYYDWFRVRIIACEKDSHILSSFTLPTFELQDGSSSATTFLAVFTTNSDAGQFLASGPVRVKVQISSVVRFCGFSETLMTGHCPDLDFRFLAEEDDQSLKWIASHNQCQITTQAYY